MFDSSYGGKEDMFDSSAYPLIGVPIDPRVFDSPLYQGDAVVRALGRYNAYRSELEGLIDEVLTILFKLNLKQASAIFADHFDGATLGTGGCVEGKRSIAEVGTLVMLSYWGDRLFPQCSHPLQVYEEEGGLWWPWSSGWANWGTSLR